MAEVREAWDGGRECRQEMASLRSIIWGRRHFLSGGGLGRDNVAQWAFSKFFGNLICRSAPNRAKLMAKLKKKKKKKRNTIRGKTKYKENKQIQLDRKQRTKQEARAHSVEFVRP